MDGDEYISSGVIESYLLGLLSFAEEQEVLLHASNSQKIAKAIHEAERKIEKLSLQSALQPPKDIWKKIQKELL